MSKHGGAQIALGDSNGMSCEEVVGLGQRIQIWGRFSGLRLGAKNLTYGYVQCLSDPNYRP